jgi:hypothetical protein
MKTLHRRIFLSVLLATLCTLSLAHAQGVATCSSQ